MKARLEVCKEHFKAQKNCFDYRHGIIHEEKKRVLHDPERQESLSGRKRRRAALHDKEQKQGVFFAAVA